MSGSRAFYHESVRYPIRAQSGPGIADSYIRPGPDLSTSPDHYIEEH